MAAQPLQLARVFRIALFRAAVSVYRVAGDDNREGFAPPVDLTAPVDCTILPLDDPDQFVAAARPVAGAAAWRGGQPLRQPAGRGRRRNRGTAVQRQQDERWRSRRAHRQNTRCHLGRRPCSTTGTTTAAGPVWSSRRSSPRPRCLPIPTCDADVGNWYQKHVRSAETNRAAVSSGRWVTATYTIPVYVSAKFLGEYFDDLPGMSLLGEWGDRTSRALMVGAPPLLAVQYLTGGGRPSPIRATIRTGGPFTARTAPAAMPSWARCPSSPWPT